MLTMNGKIVCKKEIVRFAIKVKVAQMQEL
jgi:hypothetical protein